MGKGASLCPGRILGSGRAAQRGSRLHCVRRLPPLQSWARPEQGTRQQQGCTRRRSCCCCKKYVCLSGTLGVRLPESCLGPRAVSRPVVYFAREGNCKHGTWGRCAVLSSYRSLHRIRRDLLNRPAPTACHKQPCLFNSVHNPISSILNAVISKGISAPF